MPGPTLDPLGKKHPSPGLKSYKDGNYLAIQNYLRNGSKPRNETIEKQIHDISHEMQASTTDAPLPPLYRGTNVLDLGYRTVDMLKKNYKNTPTRSWPAYTSTSTDQRKAERFASSGKGTAVLLHITPCAGVRYINTSLYDGLKHVRNEDEILLDRDTKYCITSVNPTPPKYDIVHIDLLPHSKASSNPSASAAPPPKRLTVNSPKLNMEKQRTPIKKQTQARIFVPSPAKKRHPF